MYAASLALGFYTFPFSVFVGIGHGIYVIAIERCRLTKAVIAYLLALLTALLLFSAWIAVAIANWSQQVGLSWTAVPIPLLNWLKTWGLHVNRTFTLTVGDFGFDNLWTYLTLPIFLILVGYSIYFICHQTPKRVWLFVLTLMGTLALALALPDLILGGQRSTSTRYLVPFLLGIQLSVAYLLAAQITSTNLSKRTFWQGVMAGVISIGVVSCAISSQSDTAWNKVVSYNNHQVARLVNQANNPLLISNSFGINFGNTFALSYLLESKVRLLPVDGWIPPDLMEIPKAAQNFVTVFILNPPDAFQKNIEKAYNTKLELVFNDSHLWLWKLIKH
jgi:uncharacterized membrane protein